MPRPLFLTMRTAIIIGENDKGKQSVVIGPEHPNLVSAEFKRLRNEGSMTYRSIELWTSGNGRTRRAKIRPPAAARKK